MRYRVSEDAERDLGEIFLYWASRVSLEIADRVVDRITERFWLLGEHPGAGRAAGEIAKGVKCFPAGNYLIYYRKTRHRYPAHFSWRTKAKKGVSRGEKARIRVASSGHFGMLLVCALVSWRFDSRVAAMVAQK